MRDVINTHLLRGSTLLQPLLQQLPVAALFNSRVTAYNLASTCSRHTISTTIGM
jgi:hypothetical protein